MTRPKAYDPLQGYMYQILVRDVNYDREWESLDHARDREDLKYLMGEYRLVYQGTGSELKTIQLPKKYWRESL